MLGAAYFRSRRSEFDTLKVDKDARDELAGEMRGQIAKDFLSPVIQETVFLDLPGQFLWPVGTSRDRGSRLEQA